MSIPNQNQFIQLHSNVQQTNMFESYPAEIEIDRHTLEFTPARSQINNNRLILNSSQPSQLIPSHILATQSPMRYQRTSAFQPIQRPMSDSPVHVKHISLPNNITKSNTIEPSKTILVNSSLSSYIPS
ncbi:unnamed protein product [Rotaria magnacalcarata]|uniref:Uncharacterized protein n=1 Tax=Rotaria magnacalcarata TaxID=392030 RepID=A0A820BRU4_9BILA|nr:unnamed protein product [Rotaria magnacalcarata]CAF2157011.1 unnamed protein product [Rotaria magnacalcarata]CAF4150257.1 unnamed protein product [Rotaria magnacalcarata]CAF4211501.1 unnamed protein product [Rotaria magnacalcarata]